MEMDCGELVLLVRKKRSDESSSFRQLRQVRVGELAGGSGAMTTRRYGSRDLWPSAQQSHSAASSSESPGNRYTETVQRGVLNERSSE